MTTERDLPDHLPLFPLSGAVLLPGGQLPLNIFEPRYLRMVDDVLGGRRLIGMIQPRRQSTDESSELFTVGCAGRVTSFSETGDGRYLITLTGRRRFRLVEEIHADTPYRQGLVDWNAFPSDVDDDSSAAGVDKQTLIDVMSQYLEAQGLKTDMDAAEEAPVEALVVSLAMGCPFEPSEKQVLLEAQTVLERANRLIALMEILSADDAGGEMLQ